MDKNSLAKQTIITPELYFLISKFLLVGPLQETAKILIRELEQNKAFPKRIDWQGQEHDQTFAELERKYSHIGPQHLLDICSRVGPILDQSLAPSIPGILSLLGAGRQSLLRTEQSISQPKGLLEYCTRLHAKPLSESILRNNCNNIVRVLYGRECSGPITRRLAIPTTFYEKVHLLRRTLGHLSAVYCVLFDRTGKYIITGADDLLVKLWSAIDGRLLSTFRGASAEITDLAINLDNSLLAAGSLDRKIRVWDLQTTGPVAVLAGHTGMITSVNFCPSPRGDLRYLVSTSTDGSIAFWQYTTQRGLKTGFASKPIQYHEKLRPGQAQMICASFSPGGMFLAAGSADHYVRIYIMSEDGPKRILEIEAHTDTVDSIQWAHQGLKFISGSKDGTANLWHFESQQWKSVKLNMSDRLPSCPVPEDESKKLKVTMVSWDFSDKWVITAANDFTIKVWNPVNGELVRVLRGHTDELYVLESHPKDPNVLLSAGHDGQIIIWDICDGSAMASFTNFIEGQGHGGVYDAKWSPDGTMIAATDSHGHILLFGFGVGHERLKILPKELFFHTDYRPLIRDENNYVLDEQTQTAPHLMPPPFLVDIEGNPHPPIMQRLVPGRENCPSDQLIPNIGPEGGVQIIEEEPPPPPPQNVRSDLDRLIEALANRHGQEQAPDSNNDRENHIQNNRILNNNSPRGSHRIALRRTGDVEGVRQSSGNWQREGSFKFVRRIYVKPMKNSQLQTIKQSVYTSGLIEMDKYRREMRRRPLMINTSGSSLSALTGARRRGRLPKNGVQPAYRTRAARTREHIEEENAREIENTESETNSSDSDSTADEAALLMSGSSSSETESSDYSDWVADEPGATLEPPKRSKRKPVPSRVYSPESEANDTSSRRPKKKMCMPINGEIPEAYKPPEWLSEVIPRKAPYYPQMGDEVVYLRQGHAQYLDAVRTKKVYKLNNNSEPWSYVELSAHEYCKVIGIKYEIRPPRLCCLKLGVMDRAGRLTGDTFTVKYHDMPDVLDFLVLRQTFDTAVSRGWSPNDRFRCMIGDGWWMGQIEARTALSSQFSSSLFMCFRVRWDNGEYEYMSPWDMEPIDENRLPTEIGGAVSVLPEELRATLYQPKTEEWPRGDREASCRRIINGFEHVMSLAIADPFLAPVDLNIYPQYAFVVEYPIDLSTIKARFENHFYRRITSAQFDVRYLATNAEKFNRPHSNIVKHARIITDLCLRIIRDPCDVDVGAVYHQLVDTYISSDSDNENEAGPSTSTRNGRSKGSRRSKRLQSINDWLTECRELLEMIWQCDDSTPFREPVDILEHPDYNQIVDTPMDLMSVREDLSGGNYESPLDFARDMRLIFTNSRNYNTNKRSRIYSMTLRLSTLFEAYIKPILINWKEHKKKGVKKAKRRTRAITNGNGEEGDPPSSDDDDSENGGPRRVGRRRRNHPNTGSNIVSSSSVNNGPIPGPSQVRRPGPGRPRLIQNNCDRSESTALSTSSSSDSDDSNIIPLALLGDGTKQRALAARKRNIDSEDSYKPDNNHRKNQNKIRRKRGRPKKTETTPKKYNRKRHRPDSDDDDDDEIRRNTPKKKQKLNKETHVKNDSSSSDNNEDDGDKSSDDDSLQRKRRRRKYESDHSYILNVPPSRRTTTHNDSDTGPSNRPTRSTRRNQKPWGSDSLEEETNNDNRNKNTKYHRRRPTRINHSDSKSQEDQSGPSYRSKRPVRRNLRKENDDEDESEEQNSNESYPSKRQSRRNLRKENHDDDESYDENEPGPSNGRKRTSRAQRSQLSQSTNDSSISYTRSVNNTMQISTLTNTRYPHRVTSSRNQSSSVSLDNHSSILPHEVDHNYGEPGPSTLRQTRRMLSRHQRNPDELDNMDLVENENNNGNPLSPQPTTSSRLRLRNNVNRNINNNSNSSSTSIPPKRNYTKRRRGFLDGSDEEEILIPQTSRLRRRKTNRNTENSNSDSDEDDNEKDLNVNITDEDDDDDINQSDDDENVDKNEDDQGDVDSEIESDPEDNKPLQMMVTSSRRNRLHNTRSGGVTQRHYYSDEEAGPSGVSNGPRSTRNLKRLQYNEEDSDADSANIPLNKYKNKHLMGAHKNNGNSSSNSSTNFSANGNVNLNDDSSDTEQLVSISSRGRVRKLTAKARGLLKE